MIADAPSALLAATACASTRDLSILVVGGEVPEALTDRMIDTAPFSEAAHALVARFARELRDSLPVALGLPDLWWFLEISEMSPLRGPLVDRLYALALIQQVTSASNYTTIRVAVADPLLREVVSAAMPQAVMLNVPALAGHRAWRLRYWAQAARFAAHTLTIRALGIGAAGMSGSGAILFFSMYPAWWLSPIDATSRERFFPGLPPILSGSRTQWLLWLTAGPRSLFSHRAALREAASSGRAAVIQSHIMLRDLLSLFSWRVLRDARRIRDAVRGMRLTFEGFDVTRFVVAAVERSIGSGELAMDRLMLAGVERMMRHRRPRALIFRAEHQPFESALVRAAGAVRTVGFLHSAIVKAPNYIPLHVKPGTPQPLPRSVIVSGALTRTAAEAGGYAHGDIAVCGPQRQKELLSYLLKAPDRAEARRHIGVAAGAKVIVVATSVVRSDSRALLAAIPEIAAAFPSARIAVQLHPALRGQRALFDRAVAAAAGRVTAIPPDVRHYEYLRAADALVLAGSTIAFEAIALGVMPIAFEIPGSYSAFSMAAFSDGMFVARGRGELLDALRVTLECGVTAERKRAAWPRLLEDVFGDLNCDLDAMLERALSSVALSSAS